MKSLRILFLSMMCVCALGITFTSCLGDDDDDNNVIKTLSKEEIATQRSAMRGNYEGYIHFINDTTYKEDSIRTSWSLVDSTLRVRVPIKLFCNGISSQNVRDLLLSSEETIDVSGYVYPYYSQYYDSPNTYIFTFLPIDGKSVFKVDKDGASHEVTATYATQLNIYNMGTYSSIGQYDNGQMISFLLLYSVNVEGSHFTNNSPMYFIGKKI